MRNDTKKKIISYGLLALAVILMGAGYFFTGKSGTSVSWQETESGREEQTDLWDEESDAEICREQETVQPSCIVYVCGAVYVPGVYELPSGSRINDAVMAAGGLTEDADALQVNLAAALTDGSRIYIPAEGEMEPEALFQEETGTVSSGADSLVDLNTASKEQLMELPGIGESRAEAIIQYRETVGRFSCIEDIMNVSGIKHAVFEQIQMLIRV